MRSCTHDGPPSSFISSSALYLFLDTMQKYLGIHKKQSSEIFRKLIGVSYYIRYLLVFLESPKVFLKLFLPKC
jgi:hypothetical protein